MASFAKDSERPPGAHQQRCYRWPKPAKGLKIPYGTAKKWVDNGRKRSRRPVRRMGCPPDRRQGWCTAVDAVDVGRSSEDSPPGPVELRVDALLHGRELNREAALAAAQARILARRSISWARPPALRQGRRWRTAAGAWRSWSPCLEAPREDDLDRLKAEVPRAAFGLAGQRFGACQRQGRRRGQDRARGWVVKPTDENPEPPGFASQADLEKMNPQEQQAAIEHDRAASSGIRRPATPGLELADQFGLGADVAMNVRGLLRRRTRCDRNRPATVTEAMRESRGAPALRDQRRPRTPDRKD